MKTTLVVTAAVLMGLSGCGSDRGTRAITGGGIGVVGAYVIGAPLLAGATVGAVAGAVTTPSHRGEWNGDHRHVRDEDR